MTFRRVHWSEGSSWAMTRGGVETSFVTRESTSPTKNHGSGPQGDLGQVGGHSSITRIKKRSLKRAYSRLRTLGHTWYRGQFWQSQTVGQSRPNFTAENTQMISPQPMEHLPKNRLIVFHWNGGALSSARYQEMLHWLHLQRVDIALLSETHWSYSQEWTTPNWNAIHSGHDPSQKDKASGLLLLISTRLCRADQIAWHAAVPGRVLHCRLHLTSRPVDIIGIYQHPWNSSTIQKTRRKQVWASLNQLLQAVPNRHTVCLLGDFNCTLTYLPRLVGQEHYWTTNGKRSGPQHGDMNMFSTLLNDHQLVALNTWTSTLGATSYTPSGSSRIDFMMVRYRDADTMAKQVGLLTDAPFLPSGAYHIPMITSLNHKHYKTSRAQTSKLPRQVKIKCIAEFRQDTLHWQQCSNGINNALRDASGIKDLSELYTLLHQGTMHFFHHGADRRSDTHPGFAELKWQHYKHLRMAGHPDITTLFQKWWHFARFRRMDQQHLRWTREVRNQKIRQLTLDAQQAHLQHDSFRLYQIISRSCPRHRNKRSHLKGDDGCFLTPTEETATYVKFIADNWAGPSLEIPAFPTPGIPFTIQELDQAIATIPTTRAVAPGFAPGPMWKAQSEHLAWWLFEKLQKWWGQDPPHIPQTWKDAWACWLPKPNKPSTRLENLRMLGLQEPLGKAVLKLIAKKALQMTFDWLSIFPQFAYLPLRSTREALLRGAFHCHEVRYLLMTQKRSIHATTASQPRLNCAGGIMLFIDLTRAFDQVPRHVLITALQRAQLDPKLQSLILHWHHNSHYHIDVNNTCRSIPVNRGVRQGCSIAPYLWTTIMALLITELQNSIPQQWLLDHLSIYADDIHVFSLFRDTEELTLTIKYFELIIDAIETLGLSLSPAKSCVITRGKGSGYEKWKKTSLTRDSTRNYHLLLRGGTMKIPLKSKTLYLGTFLSYDQFERQTVELRVQAGWNNFKRLKPWLCRKHKISMQLKLEIMRTCIIPTISYGIMFVGLQTNGIKLICQTLHQMYRRILGNLPHRTHETHTTVLDRFQIDSPLLVLHQLANQAHQSLSNALLQGKPQDVIHLINWRTLNDTRTLLTTTLCQPESVPTSDTEPEEVACIYCSFIAPSLPELQRHQTLVHAMPRPQTRRVDYQQDTTDGMPQCKHCQKMFKNWRSFKSHCQANVCGPTHTNTPVHPTHETYDWDVEDTIEMEANARHAEFHDRAMVYAVEADYASARGDRTLCDYLKAHCILCSRHMSHTKALTAHMRSNHPSQLQEAIALGIQRMRQYTGNLSPCCFCQVTFNKTHLCPVFLQLAILELHAVAPDDPLHFTCFLCEFVAADRQQLKKHLTTLHQFPCHDWTPARDSLADQVTCAHCGSVHHCQEALRKHIIYGHCNQFDPTRPWTRNGDTDVVEHLNMGRIDLILANTEMKRRLTHDWQFCSQKFAQVSNLVSHLLHQHGELADQGELYRQFLQQRFAPRGCSCIPRIKQFRSTHTCVLFHQMSMIHYNGNALFNIPLTYDDAARDRMDSHVPMTSYLLVHDALKTRDFELLQQDQKFRDTLSKTCLCCGKHVTLTGPSQEHVLRHHLQSQHAEPQQAIQCLIQMVVYRRMHEHLTTCDWCGTHINPTHADNEYDAHLAECPVLLHFVTWLLIPLTSTPHGSRTGGRSQSDQRRVGHAGAIRGTKRQLTEETQADTAMGTTIKEAFARQRQRGTAQDDESPMSIGAETRSRPELPAPTEHLRPVSLHRTRQSDASNTSGQCPVEAAEGEQSSEPILEAVFDPDTGTNPGATCQQGEGEQEGRPSVDLQLAKQADSSRCIVAVSQMGSLQEDVGLGWQGIEHPYERDDPALGATLQDAGEVRSNHSLSCPAEQEQTGTSHSLETGTRHERPSTSCADGIIGEQQCVAADPSQIKTTPSAAVQDGGRTHADLQEEVDRHRWCKALSTIHLINDDVQCFVNAVYLTVMWTHLMCCDFTMGSWGLVTTAFLATLTDGIDSPLCLRSHPRLQAGFAQWQQLRGENATTQQDYSEFLQYFLGWVGSKHVAQTFSRRFSRADEVIFEAKSDVHDPILLHHELWADLCSPIRFQQIIDNWHHTNGMLQALDLASHIVCYQICRFLDTSHSDRTAFDMDDLQLHLPCFTDARLSIARIPYKIAALVHYTGNAKGGHYNCAIAILDKYGNSKWLFHDDNCQPVMWSMLPEWFIFDITHVWLIRGDQYRQWMVPSDGSASQANAMAQVLAQLRD